ncbi:hypothetical protein CLV33_11253 [Jejuia pallidilutea]|uniref:Uncharacterized protein n=1 Tax=Jejuia pallidilutea TaxID=504487 RepID=A0A362X0C8_9FLAO|nr:hypothetical protein [Jejuia pallidilutea]PQV45709.1 hypothetical protein CLV33_11253 [Jejuia pallidilutea]
MKTKVFISIIAFFIISSVFAQTNLNNYKYVIVPNKFDFLNEENQYRLNELTQFLFNKYGFTALMEGSEYPEDLIKDRCLALRTHVMKDSGMFKTKLKVVLKDCNDRVVFTSKEGESREKEFDVAYNRSLRDAFTSFEALNYNYTPKPSKLAVTKSLSDNKTDAKVLEEVKKLKEELQTLKEQKAITAANEETKMAKAIVTEAEQKVVSTKSTAIKVVNGILYAQEITNGYQLVDSTPKVVFRIKKTGLKNVFLVEGESAIIYKQDNVWILEEYVNDELSKKELNLKF